MDTPKKSIFSQITNLARHSAIYAVSTALQKLPGLLLLPVYTSFDYIPSHSDFADYIMIYTFIAFMNFFYTYGMDSALLRFFFLGKKDRKTIFSGTFLILILTSTLTTLLIYLFSAPLAEWVLKSSDYAHFMELAGLILFFDALGNLPYVLLRAEEKSIQFTVFRGIRFMSELGFNILYVVILKFGVIGILYTGVSASILNLLIMSPIIFRYLTRRVDLALWKEMVRFGLPLLPHGIAFTTIEMIDRFIVPEILGKDALGVYGANYKYGAILLTLVNAFRNAWQPFFLKIADQPNARDIYSRVLTYFVFVAGLIVLFATFFVRDVLTFNYFGLFNLIQQPYWGGIDIIPVILLSYVFYGVYVIFTPGFYIKQKSKYMILFTGSAALANIGSNLILLPLLQTFWGAVWATLISYIVMATTIIIVAQRIYPIEMDWRRMGQMAVMIVAGMLLYYILSPALWVRIALMAATVMVVWFGILNDRERHSIRKIATPRRA